MYGEVKRPVIVTFLAIIHFVIGGIFIYLTLEMIVLYILSKVLPSISIFNIIPQVFPVILSDYTFIVSILFYSVFSYISIYTGYGLWKGIKWIYYVEIGFILIALLNIVFITLVTENLYILLVIILLFLLLVYWRKEEILRYFSISSI